MILQKGEKIHVIHRRHFEKDPHRHFAGIVEAYEQGVARATGYIYTVDSARFAFFRRTEKRTRFIPLASGDVLVNVIPPEVDLDKIVYKQEKKFVRITDGKWFLEISDLAWA
jgi:hypothetical protein